MPFILLGFPVHDFKLPFALAKMPISFSPVLISGAATYNEGDMHFIAFEKSETNFALSAPFGSNIPDLAPPNGRSAIDVFQVITLANLATSSAETAGVILIPPFPGP